VTPAEDGSTRVVFSVTASGPTGSQVAIQRERLPDAGTADAMMHWPRDRLTFLNAQLESSSA
jgi:hypothetical protein